MNALAAPCVIVRAAAPASQRARVAAPRAALPARSTRAALRARRAGLVVRAAKGESSPSFDTDEVIKTLQEKWEQTENKSSVALYAVGAVGALWFSSAVLSAVNAVPLLPKVLELVGLGYSTWFVYRYLLFKARLRAHPIARAGPFEEANALPLQESRKELAADVEELKKRISGEQ